jgi:hypothetical protein
MVAPHFRPADTPLDTGTTLAVNIHSPGHAPHCIRKFLQSKEPVKISNFCIAVDRRDRRALYLPLK